MQLKVSPPIYNVATHLAFGASEAFLKVQFLSIFFLQILRTLENNKLNQEKKSLILSLFKAFIEEHKINDNVNKTKFFLYFIGLLFLYIIKYFVSQFMDKHLIVKDEKKIFFDLSVFIANKMDTNRPKTFDFMDNLVNKYLKKYTKKKYYSTQKIFNTIGHVFVFILWKIFFIKSIFQNQQIIFLLLANAFSLYKLVDNLLEKKQSISNKIKEKLSCNNSFSSNLHIKEKFNENSLRLIKIINLVGLVLYCIYCNDISLENLFAICSFEIFSLIKMDWNSFDFEEIYNIAEIEAILKYLPTIKFKIQNTPETKIICENFSVVYKNSWNSKFNYPVTFLENINLKLEKDDNIHFYGNGAKILTEFLTGKMTNFYKGKLLFQINDSILHSSIYLQKDYHLPDKFIIEDFLKIMNVSQEICPKYLQIDENERNKKICETSSININKILLSIILFRKNNFKILAIDHEILKHFSKEELDSLMQEIRKKTEILFLVSKKIEDFASINKLEKIEIHKCFIN